MVTSNTCVAVTLYLFCRDESIQLWVPWCLNPKSWCRVLLLSNRTDKGLVRAMVCLHRASECSHLRDISWPFHGSANVQLREDIRY